MMLRVDLDAEVLTVKLLRRGGVDRNGE